MASNYGLTAKKVPHLPLNGEGKKAFYGDGRGLYVICEPGSKGITRSPIFRFTPGRARTPGSAWAISTSSRSTRRARRR